MQKRHIARKVLKIARLQSKVDQRIYKLDQMVHDICDALTNISVTASELDAEVNVLLHDICAEQGVDIDQENG